MPSPCASTNVDASRDHLAALFYDVHMIRLVLLALVEPAVVSRGGGGGGVISNPTGLSVAPVKPPLTVTVTPHELLWTLWFLIRRMTLAMEQLRQDNVMVFIERSDEGKEERRGMMPQRQYPLCEIVRHWEEFTRVCNTCHGFTVIRLDLVARLENIISHMKEMMVYCCGDKTPLLTEAPHVVYFQTDQKMVDEHSYYPTSFGRHNSCNGGDAHKGNDARPIKITNYDKNSTRNDNSGSDKEEEDVCYTTRSGGMMFKWLGVGNGVLPTPTAKLVTVLFGVMLLLAVLLVVLEYNTLGGPVAYTLQNLRVHNVKNSSGSNNSNDSSNRYLLGFTLAHWCLIRFLVSLVLLALMLGVGVILRGEVLRGVSDPACISALRELLTDGAAFLRLPHPTTPCVNRRDDGVGDVGVLSPSDLSRPVDAISPAPLYVTKGVGGEEVEGQHDAQSPASEYDEDGKGFINIRVHLPSLEAESENPVMCVDIPSGGGNKNTESSHVTQADHSAKICRYIAENLKDCICPLMVLEYIQHPTGSTTRGKHKSSRHQPTFPVIYCNLTALELLHYSWLSDVAGKDIRTLFRLFRTAKRSSRKKRPGGPSHKTSTLPALPQARQRSQGRLFHVPFPPLRQQQESQAKEEEEGEEEGQDRQTEHERQQEKKNCLEEIVEPKSLFEDGVEELITVFFVQEGMYLDVYAMSINHIVLPSPFCNVEHTHVPHSEERSYVVLLFLRQNPSEMGSMPFPVSRTISVNEGAKSHPIHTTSPLIGEAPFMSQRRASTAELRLQCPVTLPKLINVERDVYDTSSRTSVSTQRNRGTRAVPFEYRRSKRRSAIKGSVAFMSVERGHSVDSLTGEQMRQKLESLAAVHEVEISPRVPEKFLFNFVALMIFVQRILKRYKRVKCNVDAENMFLILEIREYEDVTPKGTTPSPKEDVTSSLSHDDTPSESFGNDICLSDVSINSFLLPTLIDYLDVCDASIHVIANGWSLRFPYTTQERLELMEDVGKLQLSTVKGLSLLGVAATNALTEEAVRSTKGQMIHLVQYAAAEEAFSEAIRKAKSLTLQKQEESGKNEATLGKSEATGPEDSNNACFFHGHSGQQVEEVAESSVESASRLPSVFHTTSPRSGGDMSNAASLEPGILTIVPTNTTRESQLSSSLTQPEAPEWQSSSGPVRTDNIFGRSQARRVSDTMGMSLSCTGPFGGNAANYGKQYLHILLYLKEQRQDVVQYLWSRGHSATVVSDMAVMKRYLLIGLHVFDVAFIEWNEKLITPDIRNLIGADAGKETTILYLLKENSYSLPLPPGTPDEAVLWLPDISYIFTDPSIGQNVSLYIRQRRLRYELVQIRWRKSYQIVRHIGTGAFGDVYEVYLVVSRGHLAMKRMFLNGASNRALEQLNREVLILSQLDHPNVVTFSHSSMEENSYCIFMELCDGTLSQRLQSHHGATQHSSGRKHELISKQPPLPQLSTTPPFSASSFTSTPSTGILDPDAMARGHDQLTAREIVLLLRDVASGIEYIHSQGIVHRDIKPCNILFANGVAKIGDFGSAAEERATKPLINMKGTLAYMSPEVLLGEPYGKPCDMWSFGCLLAEVIGLRLGHLQGLHVPALVELYKSIPVTESLPITVSYHKVGTLQHHFGESTARIILGAMKDAFNESFSGRREPVAPHRQQTSDSHRETLTLYSEEEMEDKHLLDCTSSNSTRTVAFISTTNTKFLGSDRAELPESLVDLLERLFHRDPQKRMTAREVLDHPVTWDVEWMEMVLRAVEEVYPGETDETTGEASYGGDSTIWKGDILDLSIDSA